ncbi:MAG: hypothetical protein M0027_08945 [Candidatus Dormibacteraeota bacterium]|nr:hypothetical protein [Candidatus Dormibacteraeota bacterium]
MIRFLYLVALIMSWAGVAFFNHRLRTQVLGWRLLRAIAVTVPLFLVFDAVGASRGWFRSNPHLNSVIFPPGIPLEEPILLGFLVLISVTIRWAVRRAGV